MEAVEPGTVVQDSTGAAMNRRRNCCGISVFVLMAVLLVIFTCQLPPALAAHQEYAHDEIKIGVLANRGNEEAISRWQPTAAHLSAEIPQHSFIIVPLDFDTIQKTVNNNEVDFVITNPGNYVVLESAYGATRIATLKTMINDTPYAVFGAVIFTRADRTDIMDLTDLKGKTFMAVEKEAFGGWQMSLREFNDYGIDPFREFAGIEFTGFPQDLVVYVIRDGKADAGTVRTGILESMAAEGKINLTDFRILNPQKYDTFPQFISTRLYPEWAFAKANNAMEELAEEVVVALLKMPSDSEAARAAKIEGWTVPLNYQPIHELMMDLRMGPYKDYGKLTFEDALSKYWYVRVLLIFVFVLTISFAAYVKKTNTMLEARVKERTAKLEGEINDRKLADKALRQSEEKFFKTFHATPDAIVITRVADQRLIDVNDVFVRLTGYSRDEALGHNTLDLNLWANPQDRERYLTTLQKGGSVREQEARFSMRSGKIMDGLVSGETFSLGDEMHILTIIRDITERKQYEEKLQKLANELEQRVIERTRELNAKKDELQDRHTAIMSIMEELNSATLQLEATNKEIQAFSYSVSHDLRAPLRAIEGFSQALLEDYGNKLDDQGKDYLWRLRGGAQKMAQLIEAMLSLSRLTRSEIKREKVDMSELAKTIAEELQKTQPERRVEFVIAEGVYAVGDAQMLRIVLDNLFSNAWKFTWKHPDARIEFGVTQVEGKTAYFVKDDGAGFDMNYADKLFTAFQRLHTEDDFPGIGIGLATIQRIIHRHGGRVWAEGEVEKGATFYFTL